jgi:hypothetical protein
VGEVEAAQASSLVGGLTRPEITRIVNRYVGVSGGYLGDFSYGSHCDFYPEYCDLDLDPFEYLPEGITRERFIRVLEGTPPHVQACALTLSQSHSLTEVASRIRRSLRDEDHSP